MAKKRRWSGAAKRAVRRYNAYKRSFIKRTDRMIEQGLTPYDGIPLSFREYKEIYAEERNDRLKEIEKGERSTLRFVACKAKRSVGRTSSKPAYFRRTRLSLSRLLRPYESIVFCFA